MTIALFSASMTSKARTPKQRSACSSLSRRRQKTNIIEEEGTPLKLTTHGLTVQVGHHAVETFKLVPDWAKR